MKGNKKVGLWYSLLPFVLGMFLLAGALVLQAPTDAFAAGGDITISGPGLNNPEPVTITQNQLRGNNSLTDGTYLEQQDIIYSTINTWPTKSWYRGVGVKLGDLLEVAGGLKPEATQIRFTSGDGFKATFTVQELVYEPRYMFPNFLDTGLPGHLPGDASGAVQVETIIAHKSCSAQDLDDVMDDENLGRGDANHLLYGQRSVTQQTNARFAKYVTKIEVLTDPAPKWANPTADPQPGEVPVGTMVELQGPFNDEDKVHYTLDGSTPTIDSPMYNWIASRWWSSRSGELDEINHPIEITDDTTIKAVVIGPGREDSDVVTFEYTVPEATTYSVTFVVTPADATVTVKDSEGNAKAAEEDGTYKLEPGEYTYTISKPGYKETTGTITITDRDETITVTLEVAISMELSKNTALPGEIVAAYGKTLPNAWVPIKIINEDNNIVYFDTKKADASGNYNIEFIVPSGASGTLTVIVGEGNNVISRALTVGIITRKKADVNGDNVVNILDVVKTVNIALEKIQPTLEERYAADVNSDGKVNVMDVVRIVNISLGKIAN
ncbi:hypothetical protein SPSYN_03076 [Sporotomaculum syntrophicum]|uniref:Dockerin domain-containing protein n=2 Tax=Sporotomaculum syntrophicum TaxID=182264 RepID=A0A9D3AWH7_9FIRM|nr:FN3 associated domain-containing protein [Sporotomaculum syntrophicum]KAF1083802.1 hypothetical protein SPSYN_03076 [Sporotomaculum syntrophicum]